MRNKSKHPEYHSHRVVSHFLWFPICIQGETRWLERAAYLTQIVSYRTRATPNGWTTAHVRWLDSEEEIEEARGIK